tara:strand:- start:1132 stop:2070 length:939 start_codon:yes stop_codon:yes gene_type:complete
MKFIITGGSGFLGSSFAKNLLLDNHSIVILDNIKKDNAIRLKPIFNKIKYKQIDFTDLKSVKKELKNSDVIMHFFGRANTSVGSNTNLDLNHGIISTYNVLESMRANKLKKIIFPSAPAIYGNPIHFPTSEKTGMLLPVSLYGAAKLSSEGLISAYCNLFNMTGWIFRLGNVVGPQMTRGVIMDFIKKIKKNPKKLEILGNGDQLKDMIYIDDCIDGMLFGFKNSNDIVNVFNLASGTTISVNEIAKIIIKKLNLPKIKITCTDNNIGWKGDVPKVHYDITKIKKLGWKPKYSSKKAVNLATSEMLNIHYPK